MLKLYLEIFDPERKSVSLSLRNFAAKKALIIARQRGQWRDYVDIFFLLKKGVFTLGKIVEISQKKYGSEFNPRLFWQQLCYFGDIKNFDITFLQESYSIAQVQSFLKTETANYLKKIKLI